MALSLLFSSPFSSPSSSAVFATPFSSSIMPITAARISRLHMKPMGHLLKSCRRFYDITDKRGALIVKAFSDSDGPDSAEDITDKRGALIVKAFSDTDGPDSAEPQSESDDEEYLPLDKLPLDLKLQLKLEQKMRMKFSKKVRLRRKKLIHKRRMRKKGRWPPSKMNKLKNV